MAAKGTHYPKIQVSFQLLENTMICSCGGNTETVHKVVRDKELQGEYQKCPSCGRILWLWQTSKLVKELENDK